MAVMVAGVILAVEALAEVARGTETEALAAQAHATPSNKGNATEEPPAASRTLLGKPRRAGVEPPKTPATETWIAVTAHTAAVVRLQGAQHQ